MPTSRRSALISVSDKTGLSELCRALTRFGWQLISTGATAHAIREAGFDVTEVAQITQFPEILDGRVKTLHPQIHGGILYKRAQPDHRKSIETYHMPNIDLVVVNLYPFVDTVDTGAPLETCIETIDIGGPALLRAGAKNYADVAVLSSPTDYAAVIQALHDHAGTIPRALRKELAAAAFAHTAGYDAAIAAYLTASPFPKRLHLSAVQTQSLRYGENPDQQAALYAFEANLRTEQAPLSRPQLLSDTQLSYNNLVDVNAGLDLIRQSPYPIAVVIKHATPAGVAASLDDPALPVSTLLTRAIQADPVSAFGGIVLTNQPIDAAAAALLTEKFFVCVAAPQFLEDSVEILKKKPDIRILRVRLTASHAWNLRVIDAGVLLQSSPQIDPPAWKLVCGVTPSDPQRRDLELAWLVVRYARSNAVVLVANQATIGIGSGQVSRVAATEMALMTAQRLHKHAVPCAVAASDGFFPFADSLEALADAGISQVVQPGGSRRDAEIFARAQELRLTMFTTGQRCFLH